MSLDESDASDGPEQNPPGAGAPGRQVTPNGEAPALPTPPALPGGLSPELLSELIAFRRDMHMHPELGNEEFRATALVKGRLEQAGLAPRVLDSGTGVICDIGTWDGVRPLLAIRADLDALPIPDTKTVPYRSTVPDRTHACGHDVHTTTVLGAGLVLADLDRQGLLPRPVRLIFQPAEEMMPGGAGHAITSGALEGVGRIIALHCDPKVDAGKVGLRVGPITSACDRLDIALDGPGGHTARPHLTTDLVTAVARVATDVPAVLARRVDTRSGLAVTWGRIDAGHAPNVIPQHAELSGTVRCLDLAAWHEAPDLIHAVIDEVAALHGAKSQITYVRGVPPVVNDQGATELLRDAQTARLGSHAIEDTEQSLGGEDFSWYLETVPGAMARLGVKTPGDPARYDLHRGDFDVDESAIKVGVELFTGAALLDGNRL
ncbi:amidohydrolase [Streptomyces sp. 150FB]|uniref:amidohydrolase n=1 Tax=Streptomyces sp. 150FB TaxID=1576605 RepID=UPI00099DC8DA|nr:amidohydrolase [Streptomyces sp. 150FB]